MLKRKYEIDDMSICEEHIICEECPCYVEGYCVHPYVNVGECTEDTRKQIREKFSYLLPVEMEERQNGKNR